MHTWMCPGAFSDFVYDKHTVCTFVRSKSHFYLPQLLRPDTFTFEFTFVMYSQCFLKLCTLVHSESRFHLPPLLLLVPPDTFTTSNTIETLSCLAAIDCDWRGGSHVIVDKKSLISELSLPYDLLIRSVWHKCLHRSETNCVWSCFGANICLLTDKLSEIVWHPASE